MSLGATASPRRLPQRPGGTGLTAASIRAFADTHDATAAKSSVSAQEASRIAHVRTLEHAEVLGEMRMSADDKRRSCDAAAQELMALRAQIQVVSVALCNGATPRQARIDLNARYMQLVEELDDVNRRCARLGGELTRLDKGVALARAGLRAYAVEPGGRRAGIQPLQAARPQDTAATQPLQAVEAVARQVSERKSDIENELEFGSPEPKKEAELRKELAGLTRKTQELDAWRAQQGPAA